MGRKTFVAAIGVFVLSSIAAVWYFVAPSRQEGAMPGSISGTLSYPSEGIPAQRVCAELISDPATMHCTDTADDVHDYTIRNVPPGRYYVRASIKNPAELGITDAGKAYWDQFVVCGLKYGCKDHTKIPVTVGSGQAVIGVDPQDWYQ